MWNFSSGACLCVLRPKTHEEVTSVLTIRGALFKHFVVAGWDRRVTCYEDPGPAAKETFPGRIMAGHKVSGWSFCSARSAKQGRALGLRAAGCDGGVLLLLRALPRGAGRHFGHGGAA